MFNPQAPGLRDGQERGDQGTTQLTLCSKASPLPVPVPRAACSADRGPARRSLRAAAKGWRPGGEAERGTLLAGERL